MCSSFIGNETITGDIIIMPIDIRTLATTMSMTRKGMKMMKPIWNAVFSSLVTNAGISTRIGVSSGSPAEDQAVAQAGIDHWLAAQG